MTFEALPSGLEVLIEILRQLGVHAAALAAIVTLVNLAGWVRGLLGAARTTSAASRWIARLSQDGWKALGPLARRLITMALLLVGQTVAVALFYASLQVAYALPRVPYIWEPGGDWQPFGATVLTAPHENIAWPAVAAWVALGVVAAFDAALIGRQKILEKTAEQVLKVFAFVCELATLGGCLGAALFAIFGLLAFADQDGGHNITVFGTAAALGAIALFAGAAVALGVEMLDVTRRVLRPSRGPRNSPTGHVDGVYRSGPRAPQSREPDNEHREHLAGNPGQLHVPIGTSQQVPRRRDPRGPQSFG